MTTNAGELRTSMASPLLLRLYRTKRLRRRVLALASRLEGGQFRSATLRLIFARFHDMEIGAHSYGSCFEPGQFPGGARIGRYVSMAGGVMRRLNHPLDHLIMHPYFYNENLGYVRQRTIRHAPIVIEADAWIGQSVIFTESCTRVGVGAVIGAGTIVTRDVDDFDIVVGNPGRVLRKRFDPETRARILASRWWERPVEELAGFVADLNLPVSGWPDGHPLLAASSDGRRPA
jgi:acetyltransferase-like isoleucine patch superfamily enzyme